MKKQIMILGMVVLLLVVGLSGCAGLEHTFENIIGNEPSLEELMTNPKNVTLKFRYEYSDWTFNYTVYKGVNDYLASLPRSISSFGGVSKKDFIMRDVNQEYQRELIQTIMNVITNFTENRDDQARISISIVQNIPYDYEGLISGSPTAKYPYEVLYTQNGVCGEKSHLLILLLRELGFSVAVFEFEEDNHRSVGIKCPIEYSFRNSGYCFVESTKPSIITDGEGNYLNAGKLDSFEVIEICGGYSFDSVSEEYFDAIEYNNLNERSKQNGGILSQNDYDRWLEIVNKYGIIH
jgi:hypothetical protein